MDDENFSPKQIETRRDILWMRAGLWYEVSGSARRSSLPPNAQHSVVRCPESIFFASLLQLEAAGARVGVVTSVAAECEHRHLQWSLPGIRRRIRVRRGGKKDDHTEVELPSFPFRDDGEDVLESGRDEVLWLKKFTLHSPSRQPCRRVDDVSFEGYRTPSRCGVRFYS